MLEENCLIIAGEKSGEEHCMSFFSNLKSRCKNTSFWGVGGDEMKKLGFESIYELADFSSWGFSEVIGKIPFYFRALNRLEQEVINRKTKVAILIDFQDFNMRLAKRLKSHGVEVLYYVAPQAWAWKSWRAGKISKIVHTLFTILPFEKKWFADRGVDKVKGVVHPLLQTYGKKISELELGVESKSYEKITQQFNLLLLPGSRNFEVNSLLPVFVSSVKKLKKRFNISVSIVLSPNVNRAIYDKYKSSFNEIYASGDLHKALENADFSLAASGTVTLANALFEVPTVVCYKASLFNEFIFKTFISYKGPIALANIVHGKVLFPELLQDRCSEYNIQNSLYKWLTNKDEYLQIKTSLLKTRELLTGDNFDVSEYMGKIILSAYEK